jgi:LPS export ABC transporter protein LptC
MTSETQIEDAAASEAPETRARRERLDSLAPRRRLTGEQAAARSRFVGQMRIALPVLVVVLIGVFFASSRKGGDDDLLLSETIRDPKSFTDKYAMSGADVSGVTKDGKPYRIEFESLTQAASKEDVAELVKPKATTHGDKQDSVVTANRGQMNSKDNRLTLEDQVTLTHRIGGETYTLTAPKADVDVKGGVVAIDSGVTGTSATGGLRADHMRAYNAENRVVFEGNVSMRIYPKKAPQGDEAETPR